jgi:hypothetical protein
MNNQIGTLNEDMYGTGVPDDSGLEEIGYEAHTMEECELNAFELQAIKELADRLYLQLIDMYRKETDQGE